MIYSLLNKLTHEWDPQSIGIRFEPPFSIIQFGRIHGMDRKVTFLVFDRRKDVPAIILKVTRSPEYRAKLQKEYGCLLEVSALNGIQHTIPKPLGIFQINNYSVMAETFIHGTPLSLLIRRRTNEAEVEKDISSAQSWLDQFHQSGISETAHWSSDSLFQRTQALDDGQYALNPSTEMAHCARKFDGFQLPLIPSHGDFWPGNFLIHDKSVGVVDWENFQLKGWPLHDVFLFITSYASTYQWNKWHAHSKLDAFRKAFLEKNWFSQLIKNYLRRFLLRLSIPPETAHLLFFDFLARMREEELKKKRRTEGHWRKYLGLYHKTGEQSVFSEMS